MAYKIAVGSSDKINVDLEFGKVTSFLVYEITDEIKLLEERFVPNIQNEETCGVPNTLGCGNEGCSGNRGGCHGSSDYKVDLISDCRCVVCKKIGFQAQKFFEKKAISVFDVDCEISEALEKISDYYKKTDNHKPFRRN